MMQATRVPPQQGGHAVIPSIVTLALWRTRQGWHLLVVAGLGVLAAVVILCAVPLFSQVALTAGVHAVLTASPEDSEIELQVDAPALSSQIAADDKELLKGFMQKALGSYLSSYTQFMLQTPALNLATPGLQNDTMLLTGVSIPQAGPHLHLLQGRLPLPSSPDLEIVLTQRTASSLQASAGTVIPLQFSFYAEQAPQVNPHYISLQLPVHVVGVIAVDGSDWFWHAQNFEPVRSGFASSYRAIMSNDTFLATITQLAQTHGGLLAGFDAPPAILWYFFLDASRVTISNLDDLIAHLNSAQLHIGGGAVQTAYLRNPVLVSPAMETYGAPSSLERFRSRLAVTVIPIGILTIQVFALILFFVSMAVNIYVDRQAEVVALLRSRGASRRLVFSAFVLQTLALGLLALIAGPLLAVLLARFLGGRMLAPPDQGVITLVTADPLQAALGLRWYAAVAVAGTILTMILALWSATRRDILVIRRESARTTRRPFWLRLKLDLVAAIIALSGYAVSLYILRSGTVDARTNQVIYLPLSLVGPIFLLIAAVLLFLRFFPLLLRFFARQTARLPDAPPMLALAQMSRAPHQSTRMLLLLVLSVSFAVFTLVFNASEAQQINNVAAQEVGADFSGSIPLPLGSHPDPNALENNYRVIPGVTSATIGNVSDGIAQESGQAASLEIRAVDTSTYAQTATWTDQDASQPLADLLAQIATPLYTGTGTSLVVPALVDAVAWNSLQLTPGARFMLSISGSPVRIPFQAMAEVQHIPTVNDSLQTSGGDDYVTPGGILVDLALYRQVYEQLNQQGNQIGEIHLPPSVNYIWLRTSDTASALAKVRAALTNGSLSLTVVYDRRAMIAQMQRDPLYLALSGVLILGASTTALLAVVGSLLATWLNVGSRLTSFSVLRALGSPPRQIARVLAWEQGIVYAVALALGGVFGMLLVLTIVPGLVFTNPVPASTNVTATEFYVIQHVLPVQVVLPPTLGIASVVLVAICAALLTLMTRLAAKASLGQTLRLNED